MALGPVPVALGAVPVPSSCHSLLFCLSLSSAVTKLRLQNAFQEGSLTLHVSLGIWDGGTGTSSPGISFHATAASSGTTGTVFGLFFLKFRLSSKDPCGPSSGNWELLCPAAVPPSEPKKPGKSEPAWSHPCSCWELSADRGSPHSISGGQI